jgi:hypothetical protein
MNARAIWMAVGLVAILAGGFAGGVLFQRRDMHPRTHHAGHGDDVAHFLEHFRMRLDLTERQAEKVKSVLDDLHKEMAVVMNGFHEKFETTRSRAWEDIRATLTEEQLPAFEKLVQEMEKHHARR